MLLFQALVVLLRALAAAAARALSPPTCASCDAGVPDASVFCDACARTVERACLPSEHPAPRAIAPPSAGPRASTRVVAFGVFAGALALAIRRFKYEDRPDLARTLGQLLRCVARGGALRAELVIPVPLHARRLADRGYNQAALLAAHVAAELSAPLAARALTRLRHTEQQARLDRACRIENVAGAFRVRETLRVRGRAIVLVDDVATTGATLEACCDALLSAGAASVMCLVLAVAEADAGAGGYAGDRAPPRSVRPGDARRERTRRG